jgi:predicted flap endonuclease-1-like 5' DNA nuclease
MDSGTTPLQSPGFLDVLTSVHFVLIAVLAVLTIIGIAYGMKLSRRRRQGVRELEDAGHLERSGEAPASDPDAPSEAVAGAPERVEQVASGGDNAVQARAPRVPAATPTPVAVPEPAATPVAHVPVAAPDPVALPEEPRTVAAPVATPAPTAAAAPAAGDTDLTRLKGLGPKVAAMLVEQGVPDIATLAKLDTAQADAVAGQLGMFAPRMAKDRWVEQARFLAAGDVAGFEAKFGKL